MKPTIRKNYERSRVAQPIGDPDKCLVQQSAMRECDVNSIMAKYRKTGLLEHVNRFQGNYGDFTEAPTYHDAFNKLVEAQEMFQSLPAHVRDKFANDPGLFLEYVSDDKNKAGMEELGLLPKGSVKNEVQGSPEPLPRGERASGGEAKSSPGAAQAKRGSEEATPEGG